MTRKQLCMSVLVALCCLAFGGICQAEEITTEQLNELMINSEKLCSINNQLSTDLKASNEGLIGARLELDQQLNKLELQRQELTRLQSELAQSKIDLAQSKQALVKSQQDLAEVQIQLEQSKIETSKALDESKKAMQSIFETKKSFELYERQTTNKIHNLETKNNILTYGIIGAVVYALAG